MVYCSNQRNVEAEQRRMGNGMIELMNRPKTASVPQQRVLPDFVPGIDLKGVMERLDGDMSLLVDLFSTFAGDAAAIRGSIDAALEAGNRGEARDYVHSLKGVAGNLGGEDVYLTCRALEQALREDDDPAVGPLLARLDGGLAEMSRAGDALRGHFQRGAAPEGEAGDVMPHIEQLRHMLSSWNVRAGDLVDELAAALPATPRIARLRDLVMRLDYQAALAQLDHIEQETRNGGSP